MIVRLILLVGLVAGTALGCATRGGPSRDRDAADFERRATQLLPVAALEGRLFSEQRVTVRWEGREEGFDAVVQKSGNELLLLGLGPMKSVGFSLRLDGDGIHFENRIGRKLPFRPVHILADVQRVYYPWIEPWIEPGSEDARCVRCVRRGIRLGLAVEERIERGRLQQRRFTIPGHPERGAVVVRYEDWAPDATVASRIVVDNRWFGYEIVIETLRAERAPDVDR